MRQLTLHLALIAASFLGNAAVADESQVLHGRAFGTTFTVKAVWGDVATERGPEGFTEAALGEILEKVDRQMSTWRDDSELSRFNAAETTEWFAVSPETAEVTRRALAIAAESGGAFDPTVAPLIGLWSFDAENRPRRVPTEQEIEKRMQIVGYRQVETRLDPPGLRKTNPGVSLNLSAIAKGHAVDQVTRWLQGLGAIGAMVEIGGEVRTFGQTATGRDWRIVIERPGETGRSVQQIVELQEAALASSGDYRNYFEENGIRYSHTIDPRTGWPIRHQLAAVSVQSESCIDADALATTLMVLGPVEGYDWAVSRNVAALLMSRSGSTFETRATPQWIVVHGEATGVSDSLSIFLITVGGFALAMLGLAVGVIVTGRRLRGSCGGIAGRTNEQGETLCDICTTPAEDCRERIAETAATAHTDEVSQ